MRANLLHLYHFENTAALFLAASLLQGVIALGGDASCHPTLERHGVGWQCSEGRRIRRCEAAKCAVLSILLHAVLPVGEIHSKDEIARREAGTLRQRQRACRLCLGSASHRQPRVRQDQAAASHSGAGQAHPRGTEGEVRGRSGGRPPEREGEARKARGGGAPGSRQAVPGGHGRAGRGWCEAEARGAPGAAPRRTDVGQLVAGRAQRARRGGRGR